MSVVADFCGNTLTVMDCSRSLAVAATGQFLTLVKLVRRSKPLREGPLVYFSPFIPGMHGSMEVASEREAQTGPMLKVYSFPLVLRCDFSWGRRGKAPDARELRGMFRFLAFRRSPQFLRFLLESAGDNYVRIVRYRHMARRLDLDHIAISTNEETRTGTIWFKVFPRNDLFGPHSTLLSDMYALGEISSLPSIIGHLGGIARVLLHYSKVTGRKSPACYRQILPSEYPTCRMNFLFPNPSQNVILHFELENRRGTFQAFYVESEGERVPIPPALPSELLREEGEEEGEELTMEELQEQETPPVVDFAGLVNPRGVNLIFDRDRVV